MPAGIRTCGAVAPLPGRTEASEVSATATGEIGDSGTGAAEASASIYELMSGSLVGAPNIPANGPETETD